ncbi:hypothetical protein SMMN14_06983 [Sphaerulina musiva]
MTPLYPLLTPLLFLTHQSLAAPNDQHQHQQQKPPHVTKRAVQAARRNSAKITFPPLPLSLSSSTSSTSAPPPPSCPTTLTVENRPGCGGCTTTEYATTLTQSVDCGDGDGDGERCESLVTSTLYHRAFGICPVCVGGVQTTFDGAGTSTVTSCLVGTTLSSSVSTSTSSSSTPESYSANSKGI